MTGHDDDDDPGTFASPPCFMHELACAETGEFHVVDPIQQTDVQRWRKAERERLVKARLAIAGATRRQHDARIVEALESLVGPVDGLVVGGYWPFRGEPNLMPFLERVEARGGRCALPVVIARGQPLVFRAWSRRDPVTRGMWNIPVPVDDAPVVLPDLVVSPVVGFDPGCYRLGYGGGFYDRTLATLPRPHRVLGVGYSLSSIPTIFPQWHDIPFEAVITEAGVTRPGSA